MAKKNGHDSGEEGTEESNIARFPDARERRELEQRLRAANDRAVPHEPILNLPPLVKGLCGLLILFYAPFGILQMFQDGSNQPESYLWTLQNFGFFVLRYTGDMPFGWQGIVSPVTYMFLHGSWLHLAINVATLAAFGSGLERAAGVKRTAFIFFATGIIGAFVHTLIYLGALALGQPGLFPYPDSPLVGASGGISGLFGAVLMMMTLSREFESNRQRLMMFVVVWVVVSIIFGFVGMPGAGGPIAWTAHIGGFIAGLLLYRPVARSKIFD